MLERLGCTCEGCDRQLDANTPELSFERDGYLRHAYECPCRTVTITVARR
ncbi:hypothetical protein HAPAU_01070 [Halalkalicoccus paucihalophilus]|jgi:hypothetical protein|uniref:Uncharacterized protein n=1 Tax=Halalkalicoccus paucihalophilus TaxID=1008153 RepID=A0A151AIG7_9EURY|nr:hypothetical protein [Halalkalicoccus paucihalophilus]KYH27441.1 hypothetical protein HAPAU_01070 [Halalkalicoccus paucihalophilus]